MSRSARPRVRPDRSEPDDGARRRHLAGRPRRRARLRPRPRTNLVQRPAVDRGGEAPARRTLRHGRPPLPIVAGPPWHIPALGGRPPHRGPDLREIRRAGTRAAAVAGPDVRFPLAPVRVGDGGALFGPGAAGRADALRFPGRPPGSPASRSGLDRVSGAFARCPAFGTTGLSTSPGAEVTLPSVRVQMAAVPMSMAVRTVPDGRLPGRPARGDQR